MRHIDKVMRAFTSRDEVFADFFNGTVFRGEQVISPEELTLADTKGQFIDLSGKRRELERDVVKLWRKGDTILSLLGIESQTRFESDMAIRMFAYDALAYREQLIRNLTGRRYPVISLVLYYGRRAWTRNLTLRETVEFPREYGDALNLYFNDYKLNLIDMARFERADVERFTGDFRFLSEAYYRNLHPDYETPPFPGKLTDYRTTADAVNAIIGSEILQYPMDPAQPYEGDVTMYEQFSGMVDYLLDKGEKRGEKRGEERGEKRGIEIGEKRGKLEVARNMKESGYPFDAIVAAVKLDPQVVRSWLYENESN